MKIGWNFVATCCCLLLGVAGQHTDGDIIPPEIPSVQTTTPPSSKQDSTALLPARLDVSGDPPQDSDNATTNANLLSTQNSTDNPTVETVNPTSTDSVDSLPSTQDVNETHVITTDHNDNQDQSLNPGFNQTEPPTIIVNTSTTGSVPITDNRTQDGGQISSVKPRHVKVNAEITTAMPDLTPTSQSIVLRTNSSRISNTSTSLGVPEVSSDSTLHETTLLNTNNNSASDFSNISQSSNVTDSTTSPENGTDVNVTSSSADVTTFTPVSEAQNLTLFFNGTCDDNDSIRTQLENLMGIDRSTNASCQSSITVTVNVQNANETHRLQKLIGQVQLDVQGTNYTLVAVSRVSQTCPVDNSGFINLFSGIFLTSGEMVTYAVVGAIFGFTILVVIALLCCKCWCRRKHRSMDDIPHLTMRLEDYSLTRIPRPSTIYNDGRYNNGIDRPSPSQPFDTSVVPMEEAPTIYGLRRDLQSFNGKRFRQRTVEPEEDLYSRGGSVLAGSTERLARDSGSVRNGAENPTFRF